MRYERSLPFDGDPRQALQVATGVLASNSFALELRGQTALVANGPGLHGTRQNPILGVTRAEIRVEAGTIRIAAELGGVRSMRNFLFIFPPALAILLLGTLSAAGLPWHSVGLAVLLALAPWLVLAPALTGWVKRRTTHALDTLLHNMASVGGAG